MSLDDKATSKLEDRLDEDDVENLEELDETDFSNPTLLDCANYLARQLNIFLSGTPLIGKNTDYEIKYEQETRRGNLEEQLIIKSPNKIEVRFYTSHERCLRTIFVPREHLINFIEQNRQYKESVHLQSQHSMTGFTKETNLAYKEIIKSLFYLNTP